jgi:hypothetical protein
MMMIDVPTTGRDQNIRHGTRAAIARGGKILSAAARSIRLQVVAGAGGARASSMLMGMMMIDVAAASRENNVRLDGARARRGVMTQMMMIAQASSRGRMHLRQGTENTQGWLLAPQSPARSLIKLRLTLQRWWWNVGEVARRRDGTRISSCLPRFALLTNRFRLLPPLRLDSFMLYRLEVRGGGGRQPKTQSPQHIATRHR